MSDFTNVTFRQIMNNLHRLMMTYYFVCCYWKSDCGICTVLNHIDSRVDVMHYFSEITVIRVGVDHSVVQNTRVRLIGTYYPINVHAHDDRLVDDLVERDMTVIIFVVKAKVR